MFETASKTHLFLASRKIEVICALQNGSAMLYYSARSKLRGREARLSLSTEDEEATYRLHECFLVIQG